jgi:hypothetical protein
MSEFIGAALSFPTVVFSVLLGITLVYWVFTILTGGLQLGTGGGGGGGGLLDALDGLDGSSDGVLGGGGGSADVVDGGGGGGEGPAAQLFDALGIGTVPTAIVLSLLVLFSWFFSLVGMSVVDSLSTSGVVSGLLTIVVVLGALAAGTFLTVLTTKPLGRLFVTVEGQARASLLGRVCVVQTQRVDATFGQAEVTDPDGASLLVQVRTTAPHSFRRGEAALLVDFDDDLDAFLVAPVDDVVAP